MKQSLLAITLTAIGAFLLTNAYPTEASANRLATCRVTVNNTNFFVRATEKTIKLRRGTLLSWTVGGMHQGLILVKAKIGTKWVQGEIAIDKTSCQ